MGEHLGLGPSQSVVEEEVIFSGKWAQEHPADHSGWQYRQSILVRASLFKGECVWEEELAFLKEVIEALPGHETLWSHARFLFWHMTWEAPCRLSPRRKSGVDSRRLARELLSYAKQAGEKSRDTHMYACRFRLWSYRCAGIEPQPGGEGRREETCGAAGSRVGGGSCLSWLNGTVESIDATRMDLMDKLALIATSEELPGGDPPTAAAAAAAAAAVGFHASGQGGAASSRAGGTSSTAGVLSGIAESSELPSELLRRGKEAREAIQTATVKLTEATKRVKEYEWRAITPEARAARLQGMPAGDRSTAIMTMMPADRAETLTAMAPEDAAEALLGMAQGERRQALAMMSPMERALVLSMDHGAITEQDRHTALLAMTPCDRNLTAEAEVLVNEIRSSPTPPLLPYMDGKP